MNKNTSIDINRMIKGAFAFVLAGSLILPSSALAEENGEIGVKVIEEASSQEGVENVPSVEETIVIEEADELEVPSLLPGNFFYFAKQALEKIQLLFTFDNVKEAKLLADFATERLAEAEALLLEGKEEEALEMMKAALDNLSVAEEAVNPDKEEEDTDLEVIVIDSEESTNESDVSSQEVIETDEDADETEEVEKQISQNILALTAAMEKVKNPVAKAALQKNIEKSYVKLAKKMVKLDKEEPEEVDLNEEVVEDEEVGLTVVENAEPEVEVTTSSAEAEESSSLNESTPLTTTVDKAQKKVEKQEIKVAKKEEKKKEKNQQNQPNPKSNEKQGNGKN